MNSESFFSAAMSGDLRQINADVIGGVHVDVRSDAGFTALMLASFNGHLPVVEALISAGADVNARASDHGTALLGASYEGHYEVVRLLLSHGADPNIPDQHAETPLIQAATEGYLGVVELLIDAGAGIDQQTEDGDDAVGLARYRGHHDIAEQLILAGAHPREGPTSREENDRAYADAINQRNSQFLDDRMFVMEVSRVTTNSLTTLSTPAQKWAVITRRNVRGYPPFRVDHFDTRSEAIAYLKRTVPSTPRSSLSGRGPTPPISYEEFQVWLESIGADKLPY